MRMNHVPSGVNPSSRNWPLVLAFAVLMEQRMEANAHKDRNGAHSWREDTPVSLMRHLLSELKELDDAVAAQQYGVLSGGTEGLVRIREEGADVGNLAMMVVDEMTGLHPVQWPVMPSPDPFDHVISHEDNNERTSGIGPFTRCVGAELYLMALRLGELVRWCDNFKAYGDTVTEQKHQIIGIMGVFTRLGTKLCDDAEQEALSAMRAAGGSLDT